MRARSNGRHWCCAVTIGHPSKAKSGGLPGFFARVLLGASARKGSGDFRIRAVEPADSAPELLEDTPFRFEECQRMEIFS